MRRALMGLLVGRLSIGGSRLWVSLGILTGALRLLRRVASTEEKIVFCERLAAGERLVITSVAPGPSDAVRRRR